MATLKLKSGSDNIVKFTVTDSDSAVVNLTGGTIRFKIATSLGVTNAAAEYFDSYTSFTGAANGIHKETIPDSVSKLWTPNNYVFQSRFIDSAGIVRDEDVGICEIVENLQDDE